jgi:hypothetical protein
MLSYKLDISTLFFLSIYISLIKLSLKIFDNSNVNFKSKAILLILLSARAFNKIVSKEYSFIL